MRDLSISGKRCYLEFSARRFDCERCARPLTEQLSSIAPYARCTRRYEQYVFGLCQGMSLQAVHHLEHLGYKAVEGIYYRWAVPQAAQRQHELVRYLGLDEIALHKGQASYVLVVSDLERSRVMTVLPDRQQETLEAYLASWEEAQQAAVEAVSIDLWGPYRSVVEAQFPKARLHADRFHVMQLLNDQLTEARRELQRSASEDQKAVLKRGRWVLVRNEEDLNDKEKAKLEQVYEASPVLKQLHQWKEAFRSIFETGTEPQTAAGRLLEWLVEVRTSGLAWLDRFVNTVCDWWEPIVNYFEDRLTSGVVEGLNNRIKLIMRQGYGYQNFAHFRLRVLMGCRGDP